MIKIAEIDVEVKTSRAWRAVLCACAVVGRLAAKRLMRVRVAGGPWERVPLCLRLCRDDEDDDAKDMSASDFEEINTEPIDKREDPG